jgi:UDP-glucose:(heptosyl)LPS alpha-1,3-glucosyltransferase
VHAEARTLLAGGVEVHVFAASVGEAALPGMHLHRVPVPRGPWILRLAAFYRNAPRAVAAAGPFDIVHAHTVYGGRADLATAHSVHRRAMALDPPAGGWRGAWAWVKGLPPLSAALADRTFRRARLRVAVSEAVREELRGEYGDAAEPSETLYLGVDASAFRPLPSRERTALRTRLGLGQGVWALFCGWNWRRKGLDLLLRSMPGLPQARLLVVGEDSLEGGHFRSLARDLGIAARVLFTGRQEDPVPWFQAADLFVFPTRYEPFGLVLAEAMACGLPLLLPGSAGAAEILRQGRLEQVLPAGASLRDWQGAWAAMIAARPLRLRLGRANRAAALRLSWQAHGRGLRRLYGSLLREAA